MGSWSVHCGISKIAITECQKCCILPLRKSNIHGWIPATLPIFGEYADYGRMDEIVKNENTKLIENYFGITIEEFLTLIIESKYYIDRVEETQPIIDKMGDKFKLMSDWQFMWIDAKVFDFMSIPYSDLGHFEFGNPNILNLLGFKQIDETTPNTIWNDKRFKNVWEKDGIKLYCDGTWAETEKGSIYNLQGEYSSLENLMEIPKELEYLKSKTQFCLWSIMGKEWVLSKISHIFSEDYYDSKLALFIIKRHSEEAYQSFLNERIHRLYFEDLNIFGDDIVKLLHIKRNMYAASTTWKPYELFLTPQCGDRDLHNIVLEGFVNINKSYNELEED